MEETKKNKKSFWKILLIVLILLIAATMVILPFALDRAKDAAKNTASILSGTAEKGDLSRTLSGTGTITDENSVEVTVPDGVKITEYLVVEGQYVTEGTPLAKVDKTSVLQLISTLQTNLAYVEEQMTDAADTSSTGKITAKTGGKVMMIYAGEGDNVRDVMDEYGCLAVLSIDGYLAADIVTDDVKPGDSVTVEFDDGKTAGGKVETKIRGVATVIVSDAYSAPDRTVKVSDRQGNPVGEGTLYIHKEWRAVGYSGTVNRVSARLGAKLATGGTLFTLKNTDTNAEYNLLASEHREYEEVIAELFTLYKDGVVKAENDGCAIGIDDTLIEQVAFRGQEYEIEFLAYSDLDLSRVRVVNLNDGSDPTNDDPPSGEEPEDPGTTPTTPMLEIKYFIVHDPANNLIRWGGVEKQEDKAEFNGATLPCPSGMTWTTQAGYILPEGAAKGDIYAIVTRSNGSVEGPYKLGNDPTYTGQEGPNGNNGMPGMGGGKTMFVYINGQQVEFKKYEINPVLLMNVVPQEKVSVTITVDELDILSVSVGQEAQVTVDALPGRSFTGEVVEIDSTGSNSGGNTKFTAKVLLDRQANMIAGMNASCTIVTDTLENVLLVPSEALVDEGNRTFIYTALDEDGETLINPVEVVTGASDGISTEIVSGLEEGQEFWYSYYDTLAIADQLAQLMPGQPPEGFPGR